MPASTGGDPQSGKSVERLGGGKEQVVTRQEEPVSLPDPASPRVVLAAPFGVPGAGSAPQSSSSIPNQNPPSGAVPAPTTSAPGEPKKVRTVAIRPNGGVDSMAQPTGNLSSPPASQPAAAPAHQAQSQGAKPAAAHNGGGPLSLDPQGQPAPSASSYQPVTQPAPSPPPAAPRLASASSTPVSAPSSSGGYMVQVSSQRNETDAQTSFRSLQKQFPKELGDRDAVVRRADLGEKGVYYRAMVGPFEGADAEQLCRDLKRDGGTCLVLKN